MRIIFFLLTLNLPQLICAQIKPLNVIKSEFIFEQGKNFEQCHASTIEETQDGKLLISWFAGTQEGKNDVKIWGSIFDGTKWSEPQVWADGLSDNNSQYPCWNPVLFRKNQNSEIYLFYKVGPNPREWWGMMKTSIDNGRTWSNPIKLPDGFLGPIKNKPKELSDGTILYPSSVEITEDRWIAHIEITDQNIKNWKKYPINHKSSFNVIQPSILIHPDQNIQVLCRSKEGFIISSWSVDGGKTWSKLRKTNLINPNSGTDAIPVKDQFWIVYNPDLPGKDWWEGRSKLNIANSHDGMNWEKLFALENEAQGEFSYPTIFQDSKGFIHISYTYNRVNIKHIVINPND